MLGGIVGAIIVLRYYFKPDIRTWADEVAEELSHVKWPNRKEVGNHTVVVIIASSVITLYLLPELNVKLIPQLDKLRPGVRIVSHDFDMKGVIPDQVVVMEDRYDPYGDHTLYLWTTPLRMEKAEAISGRVLGD